MQISRILMAVFLVCTLIACQKNASSLGNNSLGLTTNLEVPPIGLQLWSIKDDVKRDFEGTLKQVAEMGFAGVEFAGEFGPYRQNGKGLKDFLDNLGIEGASAHVRFADFDEDNYVESVKFYRDAGVETLIVPWDKRADDPQGIDLLLQDLNGLATRLTQEGFKFGYHNHDEEFTPYKNSTFWDHIALSTPKEFVLQLDIGWVIYAQEDPVNYIERYAGRTLTTHFKPKIPESLAGKNGKRPIIGEDVTDWAAVIKANIAVGGTEWIVLEQEDYPDGLSPLEAVKLSKEGLDSIIAGIKTGK